MLNRAIYTKALQTEGSFAEDEAIWHYRSLNDETYKQALEGLQ